MISTVCWLACSWLVICAVLISNRCKKNLDYWNIKLTSCKVARNILQTSYTFVPVKIPSSDRDSSVPPVRVAFSWYCYFLEWSVKAIISETPMPIKSDIILYQAWRFCSRYSLRIQRCQKPTNDIIGIQNYLIRIIMTYRRTHEIACTNFNGPGEFLPPQELV